MNADSSAARPMPMAASDVPPPRRHANEADRILADIDALAPQIVARAAEAEVARRIPDDIMQALKTIGLFRMAAPKAKGGLELDFPSLTRVSQRLTRIEGSVGWIGTIGGAAGAILSLLPGEAYDEVYRDGPDIMFAGAGQPVGTAEAVEGGWRISGRWPFSSGCETADWICVHCVLTRDGQPLPGPVEGSPATSFALLPARHVRIEDTWYSSGLKATASHHIAVQDVTIEEKYLFDIAKARACVPGPLYSAPMQLITLLHGSLALGLAEGALDDIVAMALSGRRQQRTAVAMRDSEIFQYELGRAQTKLGAAQMAHDALAANLWEQAQAGALNTEAKFAESTQYAIWLTEICLDVVQTCFTLGGGAAVFDSSPLQRRLRDLEVAAQHGGIHPQHYAMAGRLLLNRSN